MSIGILGRAYSGNIDYCITDMGRGLRAPIVYCDDILIDMNQFNRSTLNRNLREYLPPFFIKSNGDLCFGEHSLFGSALLLLRTTIPHVVSKKYIDILNRQMVGHLYNEIIKESTNAFNILQLTGERSTKRNYYTEGCKQAAISTMGSLYGNKTRRYRHTFR